MLLSCYMTTCTCVGETYAEALRTHLGVGGRVVATVVGTVVETAVGTGVGTAVGTVVETAVVTVVDLMGAFKAGVG